MARWYRCRSSSRPRDKRAEGARAERGALFYLRWRGMRLLHRNFSVPAGEIDLIMAHRGTCVFVEVRLRTSAGFGDGAESIDAGKRQRIIAAARYFLAMHPEHASRACRFDVVSVSKRHYRANYRWIKDAFQ